MRMHENLFANIDNTRLRALLAENREVERTGTIPDDGALAPFRDAYCENNPAGLVSLTVDLFREAAYRWLDGTE